MKCFLIAASAAAIALSTSALADAPAIRFEGDTAHIDYRDLDPASRDGRAQLVGRIRKAAERICAERDGGVPSFANFGGCYQTLVASGVDQIGELAPAEQSSASAARNAPPTGTDPGQKHALAETRPARRGEEK
jgi:UrcA family protein